jgi:hypothetical protein
MARRILLNGASGVGKRSIETLLELEHGFRNLHVDGTPSPRLKSILLLEIFAAARSDEDVVIVWTGVCPSDWVELLHGLQFEWCWLDADRGAGRPTGVERPGFGTIPPPRAVDPFDSEGSFASLSEVVAALIPRAELDHGLDGSVIGEEPAVQRPALVGPGSDRRRDRPA